MNSSRWQEIKVLLGEVMQRPPAERERFLADFANADTELKVEVARLLKGGSDQQKFLEPPSKTSIEPPLRMISLAFTGGLIGDFELLEEIGRGASGTVYKATQLTLNRPAAVKILAHHLCASESARARFRREAEAASKLRHESVVSIYSFGEQSGVFYIAMELVSGDSLRVLIADRMARKVGVASSATAPGPDVSDPMVAAGLVEKIARGLHHCHEHGVLHRDVKPENIVIDAQQAPRLIDFGLAKDSALNGLTKTGSISGTPHYMSPEQAKSIGAPVDRRTDIYSLGVVLYELLASRRPFEFTEPADLMRAIAHQEPPHVRKANPEVSAQLAAVCMKAISKRPEDRYPTAAAMADDLQLFLKGKRTRAPKSQAPRRMRAMVVRHRELLAAVMLVVCFGVLSGSRELGRQVQAGSREQHHKDAQAAIEAFDYTLVGLSEEEQIEHRRQLIKVMTAIVGAKADQRDADAAKDAERAADHK